MQSFLIVAKSSEKADEQVSAICNRFAISNFDRTVVARPDEKKDKGKKSQRSIGIDEVKSIQEKIHLKPLNSKMKAVIFKEAELLTTEAQNALLKVLEEPPPHTLIFLITKHSDAILPTVSSRCYTINLTAESTLANEDTTIVEKYLFTDRFDVLRALELAAVLEKEKDRIPEKLGSCILAVRNKMLQQKTPQEIVKTSRVLRRLQDAHRIISTTNANPRLTLEATFLSLTDA